MKLENMKFVNLDSEESIFFVRELEHVKARSYDRKYPELKAFRFIPMTTEAGVGAETVTYQMYDEVGIMKFISDYASDLPRADVKGQEFTSRIRSAGNSYGYSVQEVRNARHAGKPLEQRRADAAKRAAMFLIDKTARVGDADYNLVGFFNHPNIPELTIQNDGSDSSKTFAKKDADKILRDLNALVSKVVDTTKGVEQPDLLLLPLAQYNLIATTRSGTNDPRTILEFFLQTNPYIKRVEVWEDLKGAGANSTDRMYVGKFTPDNIEMDVPVPFEQFPVQEQNLAYKVPCHARIGSVKVFYPLAFAFADGI